MTGLASAFVEKELKELNTMIATADAEASTLKTEADKLVADIRDSGVNPLADRDAFDKVDAAYKPADAKAQEAADLRARRDLVLAQTGGLGAKAASDVLNGRAVTSLTLTEKMAAMAEYQRGAELAHSGSKFGTLPDVEFATRDEIKRRLAMGLPILAAGADASDIIRVDQQLYPPEPIPRRRVRLLDLIAKGATDTDTVNWSKQTVQTSAAAATALKTAFDQATYTWEKQTSNVRTVGHYAKAPRENLADLAQLQTLIETELSADLDLKVESLIASGNGMGENFLGIYSNTDVQANSIARNITNERRLAALHRGITKVRLSFFGEPTAIGIHPTDYHETLIEESTSGGFLLAAAAAATEAPTLWGFPCAVSPIFDLGTSLVANYQRATLWLRSGGVVRVSDSNEDDFLTRQIVVLAEMRAAFDVKQPLAFVPVEDM